MKKKLRFLVLAVLILSLSVPVFAGGSKEKKKTSGTSLPKSERGFSEAPMLSEKVKNGELPSLDERLPEDPLVVKPYESIGKYGGTIKLVSNEASKIGDGRNTAGRATLIKMDYDGSTPIANFAKSWEWDKEGKVITFKLRKGVKWSDGDDFSIDDIKFWWNDVVNNKDLTPNPPAFWVADGKLMNVDFIDDYTFAFRFSVPNPWVTNRLFNYAENEANKGFVFPSHYMKKYHAAYADKAELEKLVKENNFENWTQLFHFMAVRYDKAWSPKNVGLPTLRAHVIKEVGPNYILQERNPYYWKVDTEGNQLPYIDKIYSQIVQKELYQGKVAAGEADFALRRTSIENLSLYKSGEKEGNYTVKLWTDVSSEVFWFNGNQKDPVLAKIIHNKNFRRALSHSINREEVSSVVTNGLETPQTVPLHPDSNFVSSGLQMKYGKYDPDKSNKLLDEMGLKWDSKHEYRLRPDGKRLVLRLEVSKLKNLPYAELVTDYFKAIGIEYQVKTVDKSLKQINFQNADFDTGLESFGRLDRAFVVRPDFALPTRDAGADIWAPEWSRWFKSGGKDGIEPTKEIKEEYALWQKLLKTVDDKEAEKLAKQIIDIYGDQMYSFAICGWGPRPVIVRNNLKNVIEKGIYSYDLLKYAQYASPDQWYFE